MQDTISKDDTSPKAPKARILLADDEAAVLAGLQAVLGSAGYQCDTAESPKAALAALAEHRYDLVIVDLLFPGGTGLDVLRGVADRAVPIPVIIFTGHPTTGSAIDALRLGAVDYLVKPGLELLERVQCALERGEWLRDLHAQSQRTAEWATELREVARKLDSATHLQPASERTRPSATAAAPPSVSGVHSPALSNREAEVAELLAGGKRIPEIAERLFISHFTVRNHLRSIYRKLGVHSQAGLVSEWHRRRASAGAGAG